MIATIIIAGIFTIILLSAIAYAIKCMKAPAIDNNEIEITKIE